MSYSLIYLLLLYNRMAKRSRIDLQGGEVGDIAVPIPMLNRGKGEFY